MSATGVRLLADVVAALHTGRDWRAGLPEALRLLGEGLGVDRAFLFRVHAVAGGLGQTCLADWASPGSRRSPTIRATSTSASPRTTRSSASGRPGGGAA